jgi:hypothetical protein
MTRDILGLLAKCGSPPNFDEARTCPGKEGTLHSESASPVPERQKVNGFIDFIDDVAAPEIENETDTLGQAFLE